MPAKKTKRVKLTLHGKTSKAFTSKGPLVTGSVVELPAEEAQRFIDLGCAQLTDDDEARIEPEVNVEGGDPPPPATEPDAP